MAAASGKKRAPRKKSGGGGGGSGPGAGVAWFLVAVAAVGLLWIAWPVFFPPPSHAPMKRAEAIKQAERISAQNPDAEVFHPGMDDSKKN